MMGAEVPKILSGGTEVISGGRLQPSVLVDELIFEIPLLLLAEIFKDVMIVDG